MWLPRSRSRAERFGGGSFSLSRGSPGRYPRPEPPAAASEDTRSGGRRGRGEAQAIALQRPPAAPRGGHHTCIKRIKRSSSSPSPHHARQAPPDASRTRARLSPISADQIPFSANGSASSLWSRAELPTIQHRMPLRDLLAAPNTTLEPARLPAMFARVARVAAFSAAKKAPTALAVRCAASPFASTAVRALQTREKSTLGSLLKVRATPLLGVLSSRGGC